MKSLPHSCAIYGLLWDQRVLHLVDNIAQILILGTFSPAAVAGSVKFFKDYYFISKPLPAMFMG
jgi:hypothetical protein